MPAFQPRTTPLSADPSGTSTPLAVLHNAPPKVPAPKTDAGLKKKRVAKPPATPTAIKNAAISAFKKKAASALQAQARAARANPLAALSPFAALSTSFSTQAASSVPVLNVQKVLISQGQKLTPDGLYGPRTAAAWSKVAKAKGLPPTISRVNAKTAKVVTQTYDALSMPAIP